MPLQKCPRPECGGNLLEEAGVLYCILCGFRSKKDLPEDKKVEDFWKTYKENKTSQKKKGGKNTYNRQMNRIRKTLFGG